MFYLLLLRGVALVAATGLVVQVSAPAPAPLGAAAPPGVAQEGAGASGRGQRPAPRPSAQGEDPPLLASDGKPALPGRVPEDATEPARAAWEALTEKLTVPRPAPPEGSAFSYEIKANGRFRDEETGSQDARARLSYLDVAKGYVSLQILDDEDRVISTQMRGPDPARPQLERRLEYWYKKERGEGTTDGWLNQSGGDFSSDREEVDRWAVGAYDIARILTPRSMRLTSLRTLALAEEYDPATRFLKLAGDPGILFPDVDVLGVQGGGAQSIASLAEGLTWLEVRTPDFRLFEDGLTEEQKRALRASPKRVVIGIRPAGPGESLADGRPALVIVSPTATGPLHAPGSLLMQCTEWFAQQARPEVILPGRLYAYEAVPSPTSPTGVAFDGQTTVDLFLVEGCRIGAGLTPQSFIPEE